MSRETEPPSTSETIVQMNAPRIPRTNASTDVGPARTQATPSGSDLNATINAVRRRVAITDGDFDAIYPMWVRSLSERFWTPVAVARRAAEMLVVDSSTRVLDVGSGAGKFCLIGALSTRGHFTGIEQRPHLVDVARFVARRHGAKNARYLHGDIRAVDWQQFDAFYFFNPFAENCFATEECIDESVELTARRCLDDMKMSLTALEQAPIGTRVVTYYGLGRALSRSYDSFAREAAGTDELELWVRVRA